jgi:hypothetical protein
LQNVEPARLFPAALAGMAWRCVAQANRSAEHPERACGHQQDNSDDQDERGDLFHS